MHRCTIEHERLAQTQPSLADRVCKKKVRPINDCTHLLVLPCLSSIVQQNGKTIQIVIQSAVRGEALIPQARCCAAMGNIIAGVVTVVTGTATYTVGNVGTIVPPPTGIMSGGTGGKS